MQSGWRIGSLFGIPLLLDPSWFFILLLFTFFYGSSWQNAGWGNGVAWLTGLAMALLLFTSVLLHELGHSLVARSQGIRVSFIKLFLFGGIASIEQESKTPAQAFQVAIAGPSVSFGLCILTSLISTSTLLPEPATAVARNLAGINLVLALFNMIPGLPLDGGQVLKAAIWQMTGSRLQGIRWAARLGQLLGWAAILIGVPFYITSGFTFSWLWVAILGWFILRNANVSSYITELELRQAIAQLTAASVMTNTFHTVDANLSLQQFTRDYLAQPTNSTSPTIYYAVANGRSYGSVNPADLSAIERSQWETQTLKDIVHPLSQMPTVTEATPLASVIDHLESPSVRFLTVLSTNDSVVGILDRSDIIRALAKKLNITIPPATLDFIQAEGTYPPEWKIEAIAKGVIV